MAVTFHRANLANGLTIIAEADETAHSAAAGFFVRTGARDEAPALMGVSHFLEHMMFKGTDTISAEGLNREFDRLGTRNNAYTSGELTCFYASVLPERLGEVVDLLGTMLRPALRESDFETEKKVILEEIAMYEDNPFWVLYEKSMEEYFGGHPLGHRVLGTPATIQAMTAAQMREYFQRRYSADNTVVALAGKLDFDACVKRIEGLCGSWQRTGPTRDSSAPATGAKELALKDAKVTRAYALMVAPGPAYSDERRYAANMAAQVLGGPDNSRLHWALVETGLAEQAEAGYDARDGCGDFMVFLTCDPERLDEAWGITTRQIDELGVSVTEDDLAKIRAKIATGVTLAGERPGGRMQRLGRQWTYLRTHTTLAEELERINAVTAEDVKRVLREFPLSRRTVGTLVPA
jgi:predicted Zn-dependent peptidase